MKYIGVILSLSTVSFVNARQSEQLVFHQHWSQSSVAAVASAQSSEIWTLCDTDIAQTLKIKHVEIEPSTPTVGKDLTIRIVADATKEITDGKLDAEIKVGFIKFRKEWKLCDAIKDLSDTQCPITVGEHTVTVRAHIPDEVPAVAVKGEIRAHDQDGALATCIQLEFKLQKSD